MITIFFLITGTISQEIPTPASLLAPRNFNYHPYQQYLKETNVEPTKKGPVLFPNDGPQPPRTPLVVTSRPLVESIIRSDLNPDPRTLNNSIAEQSQINNIFESYLSPNQIYNPNRFGNILPDFNNIDYDATYAGVPYADMLKKTRLNGFARGNGYNDYEERTVLPPIYKALSDYAQQKLLKLQKNKQHNNYQENYDYTNHYDNNDVSDSNRNEYDDQNKNYAFSYAVKDRNTGDDFSHSQRSSGSATNGEYRVLLPDGRTQVVTYTADENGYNAKVRYDDEPKPSNNNPNYNLNKNLIYNQHREVIPVKEDDQYSKEYYDYSAEYNEPYKSKYNFNPTVTTIRPNFGLTSVTTARPLYDDLQLFTRAPTPLYLNDLSPSNSDVKLDSTTENVVLIGGRNTYNLKPSEVLITPTTEKSFVAATPASYLASTIASLRDRIAKKPVLSDSFIQRINKYITFK